MKDLKIRYKNPCKYLFMLTFVCLIAVTVFSFKQKKSLSGAFMQSICAKETLVKQAACMIDLKAKATQNALKQHFANIYTNEDLYSYFLALESVQFVQNAIHTSLYLHRLSDGTLDLSKILTAEKALFEGIGLCGNATATLSAILEELKIKTRPVHLFYVDSKGIRQGHIALEAQLQNKWVFLEPTWGMVFKNNTDDYTDLNLLSFEELRTTTGNYKVLGNELNAWRAQFNFLSGPNLDYTTIKDLDYTVGGIGSVNIPTIKQNNILVSDFTALHNYFGDNTQDNEHLGIVLNFIVPKQYNKATLNFGAKACLEGEAIVNQKRFSLNDLNKVEINIDEKLSLSISSKHDVCYALVDKVIFSE